MGEVAPRLHTIGISLRENLVYGMGCNWMGWKSKLVFLERCHGKRGINSRDYAEQVLEEVVGPFLQDMEPDTIFMEDGAKVHLGFAKAVHKALNIRGFSQGWPPSSPNLNLIEKVWRWIKARITQIDKFLTTLDELK